MSVGTGVAEEAEARVFASCSTDQCRCGGRMYAMTRRGMRGR
jgi:hypothetical protein